MSRLVVKNLPEQIKEEKLKEIFSSKGGEITDLKLCFTKRGVFRKFAFIGFRTEEEAQAALRYNDKTYINTSKIAVEICKDLYDPTIPRPWSKHSKESSAHLRKEKETKERRERIKTLQLGEEKRTEKKPHKHAQNSGNKVLKQLEDVEEDEDFQEFLAVHSGKKTWANENIQANSSKELEKEMKKKKKEKPTWEDEEDNSDEEINKKEKEVEEIDKEIDSMKQEDEGERLQGTKSDLDWLKSKVTKTQAMTTATTETTDSKEHHSSRAQKAESASSSSSDSDSDSDNNNNKNHRKDNNNSKSNRKPKTVTSKSDSITSCTVKLRGIPFKCTEEEIVKFFKPLFIEDIRFPKDKNGRPSGYGFVDFQSKDDVQCALKQDGKKIGGRYVEIFPEQKSDEQAENGKVSTNKVEETATDDVSELGRLFVRNLSFACTEEDLETFFSKFGELTEVNLPIDKNSNKVVGFAFITYKKTENAVKALNQTNGKIFQGRILQVLPGREKKTREEKDAHDTTSSYKREKEAKQKVLSASSHNWNALFLGANAVADVMANRLNTTKKSLFDGETSAGSVAVRMALGETELVADTREFLESHGVKLDVFGQASLARSKTVLLVKNLPPGTTSNELQEIFAKHGDLGRLLMPPFGITAIIEFVQAKDAKNAFTNLAYSKFKHTPLYLEWAPVDILSGEVKVKPQDEQGIHDKDGDSDSEEERAEIGTTIFVKNINFNTTDDKLKEAFSRCGKLKNVTIAKKKDPRKPDHMLSMGYGFLEFKKQKDADETIKLMQGIELDGHKLELKKSHRESIAPKASRKRATEKEQVTSKIIVRNIPFESNDKEIRELFSAFGHIKSVRLPKKMAGTGSHRGFAFVDFTTKQDAKRAFKALCQSTHLYGRRLVLEWAEEEESLDVLRQKTAQHYHGGAEPQAKKRKEDFISTLDKTPVTEV